MTLEEAIEIKKGKKGAFESEIKQADQLCVEAMERIKNLREIDDFDYVGKLPSETEA